MERSSKFNGIKESYVCRVTADEVIVCRDMDSGDPTEYLSLKVAGICKASEGKRLVLNLIDPYLMIALIDKGLSFDVNSNEVEIKKDLVTRLSCVEEELWSCCTELQLQDDLLGDFGEEVTRLKACWADINHSKKEIIRKNE